MNPISANTRSPFIGAGLPATSLARQPRGDEALAFVEMINPQLATAPGQISVKQVAEKLVSTALLMPMLSQLHSEHTFRAGPFKPGPVERRFQPMFDYHLADQIAGSANFGLTESLVEHLSNGSGETR